MPLRLPPSLALIVLPALLLGACDRGPPPEPPLAPAALKAVIAEPGTNRERLARKVVAERYAPDYGRQTRFIGWSMSKTVTGVLIGLLVSEGRLRLDDPAPVPRWQRAGDPRGEITLRQLLQMRSGLEHHEQASPPYTSSEVRMLVLDGRDDMAGWAEAQPLEYEPGRHFQYSTATPVILADIAARVLAPDGTPDQRQAAMAEFIHTRLAGPLRMPSLTAEYDRAGTMLGGSMIWATARDWARFGEFLRHKGSAGGTQVLPRAWIEFMETPSPRAPDYGALLWLNRPSGVKTRHVLFAERGPKSLVAAVGHLGQYVIVAPDQKLTVVRLGKTDQDQRPALENALADVVARYR